jgi:hypothetical protein
LADNVTAILFFARQHSLKPEINKLNRAAASGNEIASCRRNVHRDEVY